MTKERATYILETMGPFGNFHYAFNLKCGGNRIYPDGITEQEDRDIKAQWDAMPGWTCYYDAVRRIAQGRIEG